jgi:hypothetical protein
MQAIRANPKAAILQAREQFQGDRRQNLILAPLTGAICHILATL